MSLIRRQPAAVLDWPQAWKSWFDDEFMKDAIKVEEFEDGDLLVIRAELPGVDPDKDVEITVTDHMLSITAERREETKKEDKKGYHSEFRYGSLTRTLPLPTGATAEDVTATYNDGILEVRLPIAKEETGYKVPVTRS